MPDSHNVPPHLRRGGWISMLKLRKPLDTQEYFHGLMPRADVHDLLKASGEFLVRVSTEYGEPLPVLSVVAVQGLVYHTPIALTEDNKYHLPLHEQRLFPSIPLLIDHYVNSKRPCYGRMDNGRAIGYFLIDGVARPPWYIARSSLTIRSTVLGRGEYGDVFVGDLRVGERGGRYVVAVKTSNEHGRDESANGEYAEFMSEARIMRCHEHENIVRLIGVVLDCRPPFLVMEYCRGGSLSEFLELNPSADDVTVAQRNTWLMHIAQGMRYLAKNNILHNDLRASNCLLDESHVVCKVGDLGLARLHTGDGVHQFPSGTALSTFWLAPEMVTTMRTSATSDVWSFGVVIWEVFNDARPPFEPMDEGEYARECMMGRQPTLDGGPIITPKMLKIMQQCLQIKPKDRPDFLELKLKMRRRCRANSIHRLSHKLLPGLSSKDGVAGYDPL